MLGSRVVGLRQQTRSKSASLRIWTLNPLAKWLSTTVRVSRSTPRRLLEHENHVPLTKSAIYNAQIRGISVQPLTASTSKSGIQSSVTSEEKHDRASQMNDLATEMSATLASESTPTFSAWEARIRKLSTEQHMIQKRTGIIYLDELKSQASMIAGIALKRQVSNDLVHKVAKAIDTALSNSKGPVSVEINNQINVISSHNSTEAFDLLSSAKEHNDCDMTFLSVSVAEEIGYSGYVDWIFSCSQLIVVANRYNLLQSLVLTKPILSALQLHPKVTILLDEIESNKETISAYTALLQEALPMLGARNELTNKVRISVVPAASIIPELSTEDKQDVAWTERMIQRANSQEMLEGALSAVVSCIESGGGSVSTTSSCEFPPTYQTCNIEYTTQGTQDKHHLATESTTILDSLQTASDMGSETIALSKLSSRIQSEFVNGSDLDAVDTSVGAIKKRVQRWFTSGSIWKAMFMKVEEVSDTLVEDAILDCSFEEADLAMVHASGRLNESIRNAVNELAEALDRFYYVTLSEKEASVSVDPSALSSAKGALCALALRREPVRHFLLARHVWDTRKELVESDTLTEIPAYIRTSLTGFWAINAGSILAGIGSWAYLDSPLIYAFSGSAALAAVSFVWLGYRWRQLSLQLYRQLDYQGIALTRKVIDAHRLELRSKLDQPVHECIGSTSGLQQLIARYSRTTSIGGTNGALVANAASWRSRLEQLALI